METAARVLVVDDEENISSLVGSALRLEGFTTATAATGEEALAIVEAHDVALVVLDIMLPDLDGFEVLARMRAAGRQQPVIFLTARDAREDRVRGLLDGGDDYLVKPFDIEELVARVHVVLRRSGHAPSRHLVLGDLEIDDDAHRVLRQGQCIHLTQTEYKLLRYLLLNAGRVLTKSQIRDHVWEYDFDAESTVVETFISYLRRKVDADGPPLIHTVRGVGYCLRLDDSVAV